MVCFHCPTLKQTQKLRHRYPKNYIEPNWNLCWCLSSMYRSQCRSVWTYHFTLVVRRRIKNTKLVSIVKYFRIHHLEKWPRLPFISGEWIIKYNEQRIWWEYHRPGWPSHWRPDSTTCDHFTYVAIGVLNREPLVIHSDAYLIRLTWHCLRDF